MNRFQPSDDAGLAGVLTDQPAWSRHAGNAALKRARRIGTDTMAVLSHVRPGDPELPYRNAAALLKLDYCADIAPFIAPLPEEANLDRLAGMRTVRGRQGGREVLFIAPGFAEIGALAAHVAGAPELMGKLVVVSPQTLEAGLAEINGDGLAANARQRLARAFPFASAHLDLKLSLRVGFVVLLGLLMALALLPLLAIQPLVLLAVSLVLALPSAFRLWAAFTFGRNRALAPKRLLDDADLPVYTVLIPLRNEAHMVPQIARAMARLDYPPEKLDIKLVVESASPRTVLAARRQLGDPRFSLVTVPRSAPHTKPKALNFALPLARGAHVVVFDAEDVPEPGQLRAAASLFAQNPTIECLQAELVIANGDRNWLTRMFSAEYAGHFGVLLPAMGRMGFPVPLGGTSNHFRTATLRRIGAWDAFNVTEDADLGIRMARLGLRVESLDSQTIEEAPETARSWLSQRTRWMKGWMQTLLVHSARPRRLLADLGPANLAAFYVFVAGMVLSLAMHALFLANVLVRLVHDIAVYGTPGVWTLAGTVTLFLGYCGAAAISVIGLERIGQAHLVPWLVCLPLYWLLAGYAVVRAAFELIVRPYHWAKTEHKGALARPPAVAPASGSVPNPVETRI